MLSVKISTLVLAVCLFLLLALSSPGVVLACLSEPLPSGAQARLGRGTVTVVQYSPDGTRLAVGGGAGIWLYDVATREVKSLLTDHTGPVHSVAFSPDGRILAGNGRFGTVYLWDAAMGNLRHTLTDHTGWVASLAFSADGRTLASGGDDGTVRLWDTATGTLRHTLTGHTSWVASVVFSPDGRTLASGGDDTIRLWDVATGTLQRILQHPHYPGITQVHSVAFSPDGQTLASSGGGSIRLWDVATGTLRHTLDGASGVVFSPDGRTLSGVMDKYTVRMWDVVTGTLRYVMAGHTGWIRSVALSPDGHTLASGSTDGIVLLWDVAAAGTGTPLAAGGFHNLVTNPDGRWEVWRIGTTVTATFSSPRAPVQYHARQNPQPQFVLPTGFRPTDLVTLAVTGTRVHADRTPVPDAQPATFDLTVGPNGEMRYVDNPKVDGLGYVDYRVTRLAWQTAEAPEPPCRTGPGASAEDDTAPGW